MRPQVFRSSPFPFFFKKKTHHALGIGRATAISFALEGCRQIAISDINLTGLHETAKYMKEVSFDVDVSVEQVDMQEEDKIEHMVQAAVARFGRLDYAVNCAGVFFLLSISLNLSCYFELQCWG